MVVASHFYRTEVLEGTAVQMAPISLFIEHPIVKTVDHTDVRDFVVDFTKVVANENILEMLYRGGVQYLGPEKLSNLNWINPNFEEPSREAQRFYFKEKCWEIKHNEVKNWIIQQYPIIYGVIKNKTSQLYCTISH